MKGAVKADLSFLSDKIIACGRCPRLIKHITRVSQVKVRRYSDQTYWGKPLPGFGDPNAKLLVIGLAPAAHGGNRTGRMFTGDSSGDWLIKALFENGFASQPHSVDRNDGLRLNSAYITATVRCAPPANKPTAKEIQNCSEYLGAELQLLGKVKLVLTLGRVAFDNYVKTMYGDDKRVTIRFRHRGIYQTGKGSPILVASYHPSRQNTQTGRLKWSSWIRIFRRVKLLIDELSSTS